MLIELINLSVILVLNM